MAEEQDFVFHTLHSYTQQTTNAQYPLYHLNRWLSKTSQNNMYCKIRTAFKKFWISDQNCQQSYKVTNEVYYLQKYEVLSNSWAISKHHIFACSCRISYFEVHTHTQKSPKNVTQERSSKHHIYTFHCWIFTYEGKFLAPIRRRIMPHPIVLLPIFPQYNHWYICSPVKMTPYFLLIIHIWNTSSIMCVRKKCQG